MNILELKKIRDTFNISREEMAEIIGITKDTLNTWEYRTKEIPKNKCERIKYVFPMYFEQKSKDIIDSFNTNIDNTGNNNNFFAGSNSEGKDIKGLQLEIISLKKELKFKNKEILLLKKELELKDKEIQLLNNRQI